MLERAQTLYEEMDRRRSVRMFLPDPVPRELVELAIMTASTAPSGAHRQPWKFVLAGDAGIKRQIRQAAEEEERNNYEGGRLPAHWREAIEPLGTGAAKPYLETVPWLVVLFEERHGFNPDGTIRHNYYGKESVGIAAGLFITALHHMGLATLTHTPSPMAFLSRLLGRPDNERPFCLFPVGYPDPECLVPDLQRKPLQRGDGGAETLIGLGSRMSGFPVVHSPAPAFTWAMPRGRGCARQPGKARRKAPGPPPTPGTDRHDPPAERGHYHRQAIPTAEADTHNSQSL
jgi:nitroreductase